MRRHLLLEDAAAMDDSRRRRPQRGRRQAPRRAQRAEGERSSTGRIPELCELEPFSVFCALYLGITEDDGWREPRAGQVAARFGLSDGELASWLEAHGLDEPAVRDSGFDLEGACLDIEVAPEGISRVELARALYQEFEATRAG
jgi:hypothetical protein